MTDASSGTMIVLSSKLESALRKVRDIQEFIRQYTLAHSKLPVSVEDIQWAVEEKYGLKIEKRLVDFEADHIRGMMERYEDGRAKIFVRKSQDKSDQQNHFWKRFISVKEMAHLIIDEEEDFSPRGEETIQELVSIHAESVMQMQLPREEIQSEYLAEIAALELLYPFEFRQTDIEAGTDRRSLSAEYGVPSYFIEFALRPAYVKMMRVAWTEVGEVDRGLAAE